jgi:hypothetical protein
MSEDALHQPSQLSLTEEQRPFGYEVPLNMLLTPAELRIALKSVLQRPPCARTIRRWSCKGMPFHQHPITSKLWFQLGEVLEWLRGETWTNDVRHAASQKAYKRGTRP